MDKDRFFRACKLASDSTRGKGGIGTLSEKSLHAALKYYYEPDSLSQEIKVGGYVADIVGENGIIEIQTRSLFTLKSKLEAFLPVANVTVVHPIAKKLWNCWVEPETGEMVDRRKSPKSVSQYYILSELYPLKKYITDPHFSACAILLEIEDYRSLDGYGKNRKIRASRLDRVPVDIFDEIHLDCLYDYRRMIPPGLPDEFTVKDFAAAAGLHPDDAGKAVNLLAFTGAVERIGNAGRMYLYRTAD